MSRTNRLVAFRLDSESNLLAEQSIDCLLERRQVALDDVEHQFDVDPEVLVSNQIAETGDIRPGNLRCRVPCRRRQVLDRLSDDDELKEEAS